ncbi:MAG: hypothetical protein CML46_09410 [Rhodobacteraceae bacterium]|nr:hypothetical protein [Paracoccaceae bacterium]|tara:strand:- start:11 stop:649 length:639 start_codon:yes stop_codon:yes gene_type:complete
MMLTLFGNGTRLLRGVALAGFALGAASTAASALPVQWSVGSGGNGHWYELVSASHTWSSARNAALSSSHLGMTGYLATVTSAAEYDFLTTSVNPGQTTAFLGGSDEGVEGAWLWMDGPEAGQQFWSGGSGGTELIYANWNSNEPNDLSGEDYLTGWASGALWNDVRGSHSAAAYVVEYGPASTSAVPLPGAAPLLVAALGGLAVLRRKRRAG